MEAFEIFSQGTDLESCGNLSWEDLLEKHEDLSDCEPEPCAHVPRESVPDDEKKNDAAHTSAKFVRLLRRGARELRSRRPSGVPFWLKRLKGLSPVSFSVALAALTIFVFIVVLFLGGGLRYRAPWIG